MTGPLQPRPARRRGTVISLTAQVMRVATDTGVLTLPPQPGVRVGDVVLLEGDRLLPGRGQDLPVFEV